MNCLVEHVHEKEITSVINLSIFIIDTFAYSSIWGHLFLTAVMPTSLLLHLYETIRCITLSNKSLNLS